MRTHATFAAAILAGSLLAGAAAQAAPPQIPTPANPYPENPISTDGTSLLTGRHVAGAPAALGEWRGNPLDGFFALTPRN